MKKIFGISMLGLGLFLAGCANSGDSGSSAAATTTPYGVACVNGNCSGNGVITSGSTWNMTTLSQTYSGTTQIIMNLQASQSGQVYVTGQLNANGSPDTCGWAGTYNFQFQTSINSSLIMGGNGVVQLSGGQIPLAMGITGNIILRQLSSGAYSAYMQIIMPYQGYGPNGYPCSQYPVTMNYPGV